jgi:uncharacterized SAM-binding protein YcdF (DUF218 family)
MALDLGRIRIQRARVLDATTGGALGLVTVGILVDLGAFDVLGVRNVGVWFVILVFLGLVAGYLGRSRWVLVPALPVVIVYAAVVANVGRGPMERWVRSDSVPQQSVDAIVVLGSGLTSDSALDGDATARFLTGVELVKRGAGSHIVMSRWVARYNDLVVPSEPDQRRLALLTHTDLTVLGAVGRTKDEADRVAGFLTPPTRYRLAVVTSPMHTRRACALFEREGFTVACVPARERFFSTWHPRTVRDRVAAFRAYSYERLATWQYRFRGWLP